MMQKKNVLGILYQIPDTHPIHFVHLFWNEREFDETVSKGHWLFGRKGDGYIGIWCSHKLEDHDEVLSGCACFIIGLNQDKPKKHGFALVLSYLFKPI